MNITLKTNEMQIPDGATHYTPNGTMYVRVGENGFVETCRFGSDKWLEIPMTLDECFVKPLHGNKDEH